VRISFANRASPSLEHLGPWPASAGRGSQVLGEPKTHRKTNATGIGWCRRVAGRELHSRARIEGSSGVPARRIQVAEVGKRRRGSEKRVPGGNGTRGREPKPTELERAKVGRKASTLCFAVAKPRGSEGQSRAFERTPQGNGPCRMEGISDRSPTRTASRGRAGSGLGDSYMTPGARAQMDQVGAATEMSEARPHTSQEEDNASRDEQETESAVRRSESPWREPGDSPAKKPGAYEARVLVRRREMAEVGPTHRAP